MKKVFCLLMVLGLTLTAGTAWAAMTAADVVSTINTTYMGGSSNLAANLDPNDANAVIVTGTQDGAPALTLNLNSNVTVKWNANITGLGNAGIILIDLIGGSFIVGPGGVINVPVDDGTAIKNTGGQVTLSGGRVITGAMNSARYTAVAIESTTPVAVTGAGTISEISGVLNAALTIGAGATLVVHDGALTSTNGKNITNNGTFMINYSGLFVNKATVYNNGTIENYGSIDNSTSGAKIISATGAVFNSAQSADGMNGRDGRVTNPGGIEGTVTHTTSLDDGGSGGGCNTGFGVFAALALPFVFRKKRA